MQITQQQDNIKEFYQGTKDSHKDRKKRILLVGEFSQLNTGFAVMANDLLKELHASGKYEVAEVASYIQDDDARIAGLPWKVYPVIPTNPQERENYNNNYRTAQFGSLVFDRAVIDFKPDIVFSFRDFWHDEWITKSPSRYLFNYVWSACVDSEPPKLEWIGVYSSVDMMSSYTNWGLSVLREYSGRKIKTANVNTMPGVDRDIFKKSDKSLSRMKLGLKDDINIVLTVMRNQPRKLFPDLMYAFSKALDDWKNAGRDDIAEKTYLYLHTSYPDVGFDIGKDIIKYKLGSKVVMTYCCEYCKSFFASFFNGEVCTCNNCGNFTAHAPNTVLGLSRQDLATIYNCADLYCQLSIAGALEIPLIEAKACGIPTISTEYAAMKEVSSLGGSYAEIPVAYWREESDKETGQIRAMPDPDYCGEKICSFFQESSEFRDFMSNEALKTVAVHHKNSTTYEKWDHIFDSMPILPDARWHLEPNIIDTSKIEIDSINNDEDFVDYLIMNFAPPKSSLRSFAGRKEFHTMLKSRVKNAQERFSRSDLADMIINMANQFNIFEQYRYKVCNNIFEQPKRFEIV
jgi:glycosyltransferase involved in cell wall biosynthesis